MRLTKLFEAGDIDRIKNLLIDKITSSDEEALLRKLLNAMESSGIDERLVQALAQDPDAKSFGVDKIVADIMNIPGTVAEKIHFADSYSKGFINISELLKGSATSLEALLQNQAKIDPANEEEQAVPFVNRVFKRMLLSDYKAQGEGTGEIALAVLSPRIFKTSGGNAAVGDIVVKGDVDYRVEVKARVPSKTGKGAGSPGKFADSKIYADFDPRKMSSVLKKYYPELSSRVALVGKNSMRKATHYVTGEGPNAIVSKIEPEKLQQFANEFADAVTNGLGSQYKGNIATAIQNNNSQALQDNVVKMIHDKYYEVKSKNEDEKLDGILIMDIPSNVVFYSQGFDQIQKAGGQIPGIYVTDKNGGPMAEFRDFAPGVQF